MALLGLFYLVEARENQVSGSQKRISRGSELEESQSCSWHKETKLSIRLSKRMQSRKAESKVNPLRPKNEIGFLISTASNTKS